MASMYVVAGPIGVLPFAVPLIATRSGYKKVVEIRDMFTQTIGALAEAVDKRDPQSVPTPRSTANRRLTQPGPRKSVLVAPTLS